MIWKVAADVRCHADDAQSAEATSPPRTGNHDITSWGGNEEGKLRFEPIGIGGSSLLSVAAMFCGAGMFPVELDSKGKDLKPELI